MLNLTLGVVNEFLTDMLILVVLQMMFMNLYVSEFPSFNIKFLFLKKKIVTIFFSYLCNKLYDFLCRLRLLENLRKHNGLKVFLHQTWSWGLLKIIINMCYETWIVGTQEKISVWAMWRYNFGINVFDDLIIF